MVKSKMGYKIIAAFALTVGMCFLACAEDATEDGPTKKPDDNRQVKLDMVTDTVSTVVNKAGALLSGNLDITMSKKEERKDEFTTNALGQKVPKSSAIKSGGALHHDQPL